VEGRQIPGARYIDTGCRDDGFRDDGCKASVVDYKRPGVGSRSPLNNRRRHERETEVRLQEKTFYLPETESYRIQEVA
jgi:hypothetical protein